MKFNVVGIKMMLNGLLFAIAFLKYTIHGFVIHGGKRIFNMLKKIRNKNVMFWIKRESAFISEIVPSNSTVYINEILELNCSVYRHSGFNVSMLYWIIPNGQSLSEKQVISLNEQTIAVSAKGYTWQCRG